MTTLQKKSSIALLAGLTLVGALSACSTPAANGTDDTTTDDTTTTEEDTDTGATGGAYADGVYESEGSYESPHGTETIGVEITLADNVITAVEITPNPTDPNVERFQGEFANGIADVVVGKNIDEISVDKVAGSSLTSGGFNDAITQIKDEAAE